MGKRTFSRVVLLVLVSRVGFLLLRQLRGFAWDLDIDRYGQYAQALFSGHILTSGVREYIFPGFPILIGIASKLIPSVGLSGLVLVWFGNVVGYLAITAVFGFPTALLAIFFPPALVWATGQIYSEGPMLAALFASVWLWLRGHKKASFVLAGVGFWIRPFALTLIAAFLLMELKKKELKSFLTSVFLCFLPVALLLVFNALVWGIWYHNLLGYQVGQTAMVPFVSAVHDVFRLVADGGFRTLLSSFFYLGLTTFGLFLLAKRRNVSAKHNLIFWWALSQYLFLLTIGPAPVLENYGRYAVFFYPLAFWALDEEFGLKIPSFVYPLLLVLTTVFKNV